MWKEVTEFVTKDGKTSRKIIVNFDRIESITRVQRGGYNDIQPYEATELAFREGRVMYISDRVDRVDVLAGVFRSV